MYVTRLICGSYDFTAMAVERFGLQDTHNLIHSHNVASMGGEDSPSSDTPPVATLCNLGNTCFLNSILYTLRFAPSFLHNLHHLVKDLEALNQKQQQCKVRPSFKWPFFVASGKALWRFLSKILKVCF